MNQQNEKIRPLWGTQNIMSCCYPSNILKTYRFDSYQGTDQKTYKKLKKYANNFKELEKENIGLILCGDVGRGKTYLACSVANELMEQLKIEVKFYNLSTLLKELSQEQFKDKSFVLSQMEKVPLIILDDFGVNKESEYKNELLYQIINTRYLSNKPLIITTNLSLNQLKDKSCGMMLQRIYDRVLEMCVPIYVQGDNYRDTIRDNKKQSLINLFNQNQGEENEI